VRRRRIACLAVSVAGLIPLVVVLAVPSVRTRLRVRYLLRELGSSDFEARTRAATEIARIGRPAIDADLDIFLARCAEKDVLRAERYERSQIVQWQMGTKGVWLRRDFVLAIESGSKEPASIALKDEDWRDVLVHFHARIVKGTWSFLGHVGSESRPDVSWDRVPVSTPEGRWATVQIAVISGLYQVQVDQHAGDVAAEPSNGTEFGGIGFQVDQGGELELKDVEVRVLTRREGR
jgi:hypothetical protein